MAPSLKAFENQLRDNLSGDVDFAPVTRGMFATDASHYQIVPAGVVFPRDENDVVETMQLAAEFGVPVTARGAGTSLSGQTHGPGIILDCSQHMDQILSIDPEARTARVQPGVIRDSLNAAVSEHGLFFAPDPATTSRCTIGGMMGNNSAGMRSVHYGQTSEHIVSARVVLASGEVVTFDATDSDDPSVQRLRSELAAIIEPRRAEIAARYPDVPRQVGGYALDQFSGGPRSWNLARLLCGSEGTLAIVLELVVRLEPIPATRALCVMTFDSLDAALRPLPSLLEHKPTAIELLDEVVLKEAVVNPSTRHLCGFLNQDDATGSVEVPKALHVVEFSGTDAAAVAERFAGAMRDSGIGQINPAHPVISDAAGMNAVWAVRRLGLGLITNTPGPVKGQAFIEDACLPVATLADYIGDVQAICAEQGLRPPCVYAHASVGVLHVRPMLDLHQAADIERMCGVAEAVFERVLHYGGAWSGEHGDGIVRGEFLERYFGAELMTAFREVKTLFDPDNLLNPNKLIDPPPMSSHLRYQQDGYAEHAAAADRRSHFNYRAQGGFAAAVEQCNGVGACRKLAAGVMCPSFRATRRELDCTRGRANALRLAISGQLEKIGGGADPEQASKPRLADDGLADAMSLCLGCKACQSECPNAVDVAKFKGEVLQARHDQHGASPATRLIGSSATMATRTARFPALIPLANFGSGFIARAVGFDPRRPMPLIAPRPLTVLARKAGLGQVPANEADVILFNDTSTNVYDPEIGIAALRLLYELGHEVHLATVGDSQRARISQGLLRDAKSEGAAVLERLASLSAGKPIIVLEPSCASSLSEDLPDLVEPAPAPLDIVLLPDFLVRTGARVRATEAPLLIHGHCHHKAVFGLDGLRSLLPDAEIIEAGCCGMAGAFGFQHYDLSLQIGEDRLFPAIRSAETETVYVADGFSCRHQIEHACRVEVLHLAQVLTADSLRHSDLER